MLLVDHQIRKLCIENDMLNPFSESVSGSGIVSYGLTSGGYDLRMDPEVLMFKNTYGEIVDPKRFKEPGFIEKIFDRIRVEPGKPIILPGHNYLLAKSFEYIKMPRNLKARCVGKSTLARVGVIINTTPLEPNWHGFLTIEISNSSPCPVALYPLEGIAQLEFETLAGVCESDYESKGGKYQGQIDVTPAIVL